jgi:hypothetical protein
MRPFPTSLVEIGAGDRETADLAPPLIAAVLPGDLAGAYGRSCAERCARTLARLPQRSIEHQRRLPGREVSR